MMKLNLLVNCLTLLLLGVPTFAGSLVFHESYHRFTVPEGQLALACLELVGKSSVEDFQKSQGLNADGIVGPRTWAIMSENLKQKQINLLGEVNAQAPVRLKLEQGGKELKLTMINLTGESLF